VSLPTLDPRTHGSRLGSCASTVFAALVLAACHDSSDPAPAPAHPENPVRLLEAGDALPGIQLAVTSVEGATSADGSFRVGDKLTVHFTARTTDGDYLNVAELDGGSIYVSGPTFNYQRVIAEQTDLRSAAIYEGDGVWSYQFTAPIPATYLAPLNDTTDFVDGELTGQALLAGTYSVGMQLDATYVNAIGREYTDAGTVVADFLYGGATTITPRAVTQADNCNVCHTDLRVHGGKRKNVSLCVLCHTAGAEDSNVNDATPGTTIEMKVMIHRLHNAAHLPSVLGMSTDSSGDRVYPGQGGAITPASVLFADDDGSTEDFSDVTFPVWPNFNIAMPRDAGYSALSATDPDGSGPLRSARSCEDTVRMGVTACAKCHGDPDGADPLTAPSQGSVIYSQPTRRACGSCHDDIDWTKPYTANGLTMDPQADDSHCIECHTDVAANQTNATLKPISVTEAHVHPLVDATVNTGVNAVVTAVSGGTGTGGNFQEGDTPTLTLTLKNDAGADIGLSTMDSSSAFFFGPTTARQLIMPLTSANGMSLNPFDFSGRLQAVSTSNKGSMSKVFQGGTAVAETLVVEFTSSTAFTVTGTTSGSLGTGTLPSSTSTYPSGATVTGIELGSALSTGTFQITFSSATHFDVSGIVTGSGDLPASTSSSTRFTSDDLSFLISAGSTAYSAGNTWNGGVFRGDSANPVLFAILAGRNTAFSSTAGAPDRFYYEVVPDADSYAVTMPMDITYEFLGDSTATIGQTLNPGNVPVYYGRQQLWAASTTATTTTSTDATGLLGRQIDINPTTGFANSDVVVIEPGAGVGQREYVQITPAKADGTTASSGDTTTRIYVRTPLRYAHSAAVTITKVTLALQQEGASNVYELTPGSRTAGSAVVTSNVAFPASAGMVMSYRTDARFGYLRDPADSVQAYYVPPANDTEAIGQEQGDWQALPYLSGTYTADIWFYKNIYLGLQNESQTYRSTSNSGFKDFLFGSATTMEPREVISDSANCYSCHNDVLFHGGGRRGVDTCLTCHGISGNTSGLLPGSVPIELRQMLHKIHMGEDLPDAATYPFATEGTFPAMPGGVQQCVRCHGNDSWKAPAAREHSSASTSVLTWTVSCGSCHSANAAQAHIAANTSGTGAEACAICHDVGREYATEKVHLPR
jgi:hypothetical protein